jgi:hypothetical protein
MKVLEIVLAGTTNFDNLRRHSDEECRTYQSSTAVPFLQRELLQRNELDKAVYRRSSQPQAWRHKRPLRVK